MEVEGQIIGLAFARILDRARRRVFEHYRGLTFIAVVVADAEHRSDSVEEPSHAGAHYRIHSAFEGLLSHFVFVILQRSEQRRVIYYLTEVEGDFVFSDLDVVSVFLISVHIAEARLPRFFHRAVAADHADAFEVGKPFHPAALAEQELSSPDRSVVSVSRSVEAYSDHRAFYVVLSHDARDMGVMMLDPEDRQSVLLGILLREARRVVERMLVAYHHVGLYAEQSLEPLDRLFVEASVLDRVHIAEVLAYVSERSLCKRERILQLRSGRQYGPAPAFYEQRHGRIALRPSDHLRVVVDDPYYGVVHRDPDLALVEERLGDQRLAVEHREHLVFVLYDRHAAHVSAGHDQRASEHVHHYILGAHARKERSDEAALFELAVVSRPHVLEIGDAAPFEQDYRPGRRSKQLFFDFADMAVLPDLIDVSEHYSERLVFSSLDRPEISDRILVERIGDEVVAAHVLERYYSSLFEKSGRLFDLRLFSVVVSVQAEVHLRSAVMARYGLRVISAVSDVFVLLPA